jgi:GMP synthase-like glutamine amidotransferase
MSFGGTMHPHEHEAHPWLGAEIEYLEDALAAGVPTLGIASAQLLARAAGGEVVPSAEKEIAGFMAASTR